MEMQYSELGRVAASRDRCGLPVPSFSNRKAFCNLPIFFPARHLPTYTWRASSSQNTLINLFACTLSTLREARENLTHQSADQKSGSEGSSRYRL
jgi:hypothetical protein